MRGFLRWLGRTALGIAIVFVGGYTVVGAAIALMIVTGRLVPGQPMIFEANTPSLSGVLLFVLAGSAIVAVCAWARGRLAPPKAA